MTIYAFGPINGDLATLEYSIDQLDIDVSTDKLWFCGNVIGAGTANIALLEKLKSLGKHASLVLGPSELTFMAMAEGSFAEPQPKLYEDMLQTEQVGDWVKWLAAKSLLLHESGFTMVHGGLPSEWSLSQAMTFAIEAESSLSMGNRKTFFENVMAEGPPRWHAKLRGWKRTRFIINALTRMTYFDEKGRFDFSVQPGQGGEESFPWYEHSERGMAAHKLICAYGLQSADHATPNNVYPLQWPDEQHVLKVLRLAEQPEMFSFLRV